MKRSLWVTAVVVFALAGCAHPERIKTLSKDQEVLLAGFKGALEDVRVRVRRAFDESITDYRAGRLRVFLNAEANLLSARIEACIRSPEATCDQMSGRARLNQASQYLAAAQASLFAARFCSTDGTWNSFKKAWMRMPEEQCPAQPWQTVERLEKARDTLDEKLGSLAQALGAVQDGNAIIDKYLQVKIEIKAEDVDAAKGAIDKATRAVTDAREALEALAKQR